MILKRLGSDGVEVEGCLGFVRCCPVLTHRLRILEGFRGLGFRGCIRQVCGPTLMEPLCLEVGVEGAGFFQCQP